MRNKGIARPNWAQREKKMAKDDNRKPDFTWYPQGVPQPPPAAQPQAQHMDASGQPVHREAPPQETAPLCAAAAAMHPLPQSSSPSIFPLSSGMRQPHGLPECPRRTCMASNSSSRSLPSARRICPRQLVEHLDSSTGYSRSIGLILATYPNNAITECAQLRDNTVTPSCSSWTPENRAHCREHHCSPVLPRLLAV